MKEKSKREGPLKINLGFNEAIKGALTVKPPHGGWKPLERASKHRRRRKARTAN